MSSLRFMKTADKKALSTPNESFQDLILSYTAWLFTSECASCDE